VRASLARPGVRAGLFAALKAQERSILQEIAEIRASKEQWEPCVVFVWFFCFSLSAIHTLLARTIDRSASTPTATRF